MRTMAAKWTANFGYFGIKFRLMFAKALEFKLIFKSPNLICLAIWQRNLAGDLTLLGRNFSGFLQITFPNFKKWKGKHVFWVVVKRGYQNTHRKQVEIIIDAFLFDGQKAIFGYCQFVCGFKGRNKLIPLNSQFRLPVSSLKELSLWIFISSYCELHRQSFVGWMLSLVPRCTIG